MSSPTTPARRGAGDAGVLGWVAAGGAVGALLRWALELLTPVGAVLPWSTLLVNVLGSAALAWLLVRDERRPGPVWLRPGVGTGLLGGFTTFSTYAVQVTLATGVAPATAAAYLLGTPVLCVVAAALGGGAALRWAR
ncbi:FluC/FEX family fluoride channel [Serinicoccus marinus]|uniref:FluC/FEX family fluoride channel n=1 Tax=Serinicoccus marinus TaxID=247333 RepID=UPI00248F554B|nr:CrcB family protein [Serinicoccus marinus]